MLSHAIVTSMDRETKVRHTLFICMLISLFPPIAKSEADGGLYTYSAGLATASPMESSSDNQFQQTYYPGGMDPMDPAYPIGLNFDTNRCKNNTSYIWCLPQDYNQEKHPFSYYKLENKSLPWDYNFKFVIDEISNINDKDQSMMISMYFAVSWIEPRLVINATARDWTEDSTGPVNQVNESPETLKYIWYPELEIYGLETFDRQRVLKEMSGVRIRKNKTINYELNVRITISCRMNFDDYPLDAHTCQFQVGSYYDTQETVTCKSHTIYDQDRQRSLQRFLQIMDLPHNFHTVDIPSGIYSACGFQVRLQRKQMQFVVQVYLPSAMFVIVSWVSFLVKPEVVPGRMAMLVTLFLVLINICNSVREQAPTSSKLNAVDLYLVVCVFFVFAALIEYAVILLLLKERRKPRRAIKEEIKTFFSNGDVNQAGRNGNRNHHQHTEENVDMLELDDVHQVGRTSNEGGESPKQKTEAGLSARKQALVDNIDAWAMWVSPPIFLFFNLIYWIAYSHGETELLSEPD